MDLSFLSRPDSSEDTLSSATVKSGLEKIQAYIAKYPEQPCIPWLSACTAILLPGLDEVFACAKLAEHYSDPDATPTQIKVLSDSLDASASVRGDAESKILQLRKPVASAIDSCGEGALSLQVLKLADTCIRDLREMRTALMERLVVARSVYCRQLDPGYLAPGTPVPAALSHAAFVRKSANELGSLKIDARKVRDYLSGAPKHKISLVIAERFYALEHGLVEAEARIALYSLLHDGASRTSAEAVGLFAQIESASAGRIEHEKNCRRLFNPMQGMNVIAKNLDFDTMTPSSLASFMRHTMSYGACWERFLDLSVMIKQQMTTLST